jgi:CheY-like chemotaxis protein
MTPARILVVEDDRVVARDIEQQLSSIGHVVVATTARGEDALPLARDTQPDLVLGGHQAGRRLDGIDAPSRSASIVIFRSCPDRLCRRQHRSGPA